MAPPFSIYRKGWTEYEIRLIGKDLARIKEVVNSGASRPISNTPSACLGTRLKIGELRGHSRLWATALPSRLGRMEPPARYSAKDRKIYEKILPNFEVRQGGLTRLISPRKASIKAML